MFGVNHLFNNVIFVGHNSMFLCCTHLQTDSPLYYMKTAALHL